MQVIPADWQSKIEQHIVTMETAMDHAMMVPPGDEHARRWHIYEAICEDFLTHIRDTYNSVEDFEDFLKGMTREAYRLSGHDDIPEGYWPPRYPNVTAALEAQDLASHYTHVFKSQIEMLAERARDNAPKNAKPEQHFMLA